MATLLFEIWETDNSTECISVSALGDASREPGDRFVKAFHASTHDEASQVYYDHYGWGAYSPIKGVTDIPFSDEEHSSQKSYLTSRVAKF